MFKRGSKSWLISNLVFSLVLIAFGVCNLVFSNNPGYQTVMIVVVGSIVTFDAIGRLIMLMLHVANLAKDKIYAETKNVAIADAFELAVGISVIYLGSLLHSKGTLEEAQLLFKFLGDFFGIAALVLAGIALIYGIILAVKTNRPLLDIVLIIIGAAILIAVGILIIIFLKNENVLIALFIAFGILFIVVGIALLTGVTIGFQMRARREKAEARMMAEEKAKEEELYGTVENPKHQEEPAEEKGEEKK